MLLKRNFVFISCFVFLAACSAKKENLEGTWQLISGTVIQNHDTTVTYYTKNKRFIKIVNGSHFAFLLHDLTKGKDSTASFSAGAGTYSLKDNLYTEQLEYCNDREWEGHSFPFTITIHEDTLIQQGIEKLVDLGVERSNTEKYIRLKK